MDILNIRKYILSQISKRPVNYMTLHNTTYTQDVFDSILSLASEYIDIPKSEADCIASTTMLFAAGYYRPHALKPIYKTEALLQDIAAEIFSQHGATDHELAISQKLITTLTTTNTPDDLYAQIAQDVLTAFLGQSDFFYQLHLLKYEEERYGLHLNIKDWYQSVLQTLISHSYFTPQAKEKYQVQKAENIAQMRLVFP